MSAPMSAAEIRDAFLKFFEQHGHRRVGSSSLVPANDPTLLFTNAGMVQFKDVFTGREPRDYKRATTSQKCVRAGGKHNDLDNVGFTARHHTFFEMLGNFSFGDYFKADAIAFAWQFVTQVLGLPKERLSVTVFKGEAGIPADDEAYELWAKQGVAKDRIRRLGLADNFWSMGDVGPCGPCSEIYFYLPDGPVKEGEYAGESDSWVEIWNLVFMQFERKEKDGALLALPRPSIDTGAGLERVTAAVQGKKSNYDTDVFGPLLAKAAALSKKQYGANEADDASMRVIADHSRATAFLIADGVQPSNEGRGYVLRRIMRRAIRHGSRLGLSEPFFDQTVDAVISQMGAAYPELKESRAFILEATRHEEESFRRTLDRGLKLIDEETQRLKSTGGKVISGDAVFLLHDTHGFPWDLTQVIAKERGLDIDLDGYQKRMTKQRDGSFGGSGEKAVSEIWLTLASRLKPTTFTGYETTDDQGQVLALVQKGAEIQSARAGAEVELVLDQTCFYAESGGQVGDTGQLKSAAAQLEVLDTIKPVATLHVHKVKVVSGELKVGDALQLQVDVARRNAIRANHSATHLLHRALKIVLGDAVKQAGSVVHPDSFRFDYSCFQAPAPEQLEKVEDLVNGWIRDNATASTRVMALDEARASGAIAMFGEKYGERVRVVSVHPESTELCGGTHARATGEIGLFKITQESSIASGVRRIVAVTGVGAFALVRELDKELKRAADVLKAPRQDVVKRIEALQARVKEQDAELKRAQLKAQTGASASFVDKQVGAVKVRTQQVSAPCDANVMRELADRYRDQLQSGVVGLGGETADGKALILVAATKDIVAKGFKAGEAVRQMAETVGGKGGGKPDLAQAGGTDPSKIPQALERLYELVKV
ncbi:MAG: Alanyl-tRNA synthetase [Myxococcaceae bacterium]|nr:Alanyl-tRNA synthetase [Myxococcaceae bacterium]